GYHRGLMDRSNLVLSAAVRRGEPRPVKLRPRMSSANHWRRRARRPSATWRQRPERSPRAALTLDLNCQHLLHDRQSRLADLDSMEGAFHVLVHARDN